MAAARRSATIVPDGGAGGGLGGVGGLRGTSGSSSGGGGLGLLGGGSVPPPPPPPWECRTSPDSRDEARDTFRPDAAEWTLSPIEA